MPMVLVIVVVQVLVTFGRVSSHLSWPSEIGLVPYFLQHLLYWLPEHGIHRLCVTLSSLSRKISSRLVMVISFRHKIICFGGNDLLLSPSLQLIFLHPFVLVDPIHQLMIVGNWFTSEGFP